MRAKSASFFLILFFLFHLHADELTNDPPPLWPCDCIPCGPPVLNEPPVNPPDCDVHIDLRNPLYENGCISTEEGGVLTFKNLRAQAMHIRYVKNLECEEPQFSLFCEGRLLITYGGYVIVGESLEYDFLKSCGKIVCGKTAAFPWFLGGDEIYLLCNGDIEIINGYITTSECGEEEVVARAEKIVIADRHIVTASGLKLEIEHIPVFAWPKIKIDLDSTYDSPIAFNFGWNGFLGTHLGVRYHFLTLGELRGYARLDGYLGRGLGIGLETEYEPDYRTTEMYTRNYYAHDLSINDPKKRDRYRVQGSFCDRWWFDGTMIHLLYDFVSDPNFAQDYERDDFALNPAGRTELEINKQADFWTLNLYTLVRVNSFQTINEELPTVEYGLHPFEIFGTKIISDNVFRASYLDYEFSTDIHPRMNFKSGRFEARPRLYRPFQIGAIKITPTVTGIGIGYSNSPSGHSVGQAVFDLEIPAEVQFERCLGAFQHIATPYLDYHFLSAPRAPLNNIFLFTIDDAYSRLNILRFGLYNTLFLFSPCGLNFPITLDLWANAFIHTKTVPKTIPKGYYDLQCQVTPRLFLGSDGAWNFEHKKIDYVNARIEWTVSNELAFSTEYRHRSRFYYRKADFYNFLLESVREEEAVLATPISERRDTFLARCFYRLNPDYAARVEYRHGWNRIEQPHYTEYHAQVEGRIFQHWKVLFSYEKRTEDHRFSVTMKLDQKEL